MLSNYLKIALRHLGKQKGYAFINIAGLSVGIACCLLIVLFVLDELSYATDKGSALDDRQSVVRAKLLLQAVGTAPCTDTDCCDCHP